MFFKTFFFSSFNLVCFVIFITFKSSLTFTHYIMFFELIIMGNVSKKLATTTVDGPVSCILDALF